MTCKTETIAVTRSLAFLQSAIWLMEQGEYAAAREIAEEGICEAESAPGFAVAGKLRDLLAVILVKQRIGKRDTVSILGKSYFVGTEDESTDLDADPPVGDPSKVETA